MGRTTAPGRVGADELRDAAFGFGFAAKPSERRVTEELRAERAATRRCNATPDAAIVGR